MPLTVAEIREQNAKLDPLRIVLEQIRAFAADAALLETTLNETQGRVNTLQAQRTTLMGVVNGLRQEEATVRQAKSDIEASILRLQSSFDDIRQAEENELNRGLDLFRANIQREQARLTAALEQEISRLKREIQELEDRKAALENGIERLREALGREVRSV